MGGAATVKRNRSESITATPPAPRPAPPAPARAEPTGGLFSSWVRFWFTPADPIGLHVVRVLAGLLFLAWLLPLAGHIDALYGLNGWFDQQAYAEAAKLTGGPPKPITWSVLYLAAADPRLLTAAYWLSVGVVLLFTLGLFPRITGVLSWVVAASFTAHPAMDADADPLLLLLAFYLMLGYLLLGLRDGRQSWATRLLGPLPLWLQRCLGRTDPVAVRPSVGANVALRLLQVHLAIAVVAGGLHKLQFGDWWAGVALWFPLHPPFETTVAAARAASAQAQLYLGLLSVAAYLTLAWQLTFPVFAWRPRWRWLLLGGAVIGWLGTAFVYRQPLVGPALLVGCLSFVSPAAWHLLADLLSGLPVLRRLASARPEANEAAASLVPAGQR